MPVFLRKAVSVGPFRFNLSKSGVGLSAGVRGLRLGTGPRGNYVHMGRQGLYYRRSLNSPGSRPQTATPPRSPVPTAPALGPLEDIESADVTQMVDATAQELVDEINSKVRMAPVFPIALAAAAGTLLALLILRAPPWSYVVWTSSTVLVAALAKYRDLVARSVVVMYDLDSSMLEAYGRIHDAITTLGSSSRTWHIPQSAAIKDTKYHGGASTAVKRETTAVGTRRLPTFKTNVDIPVLTAGKQLLALTPERLLVFEGKRVGAVPYSDLSIQIDQTKFIESEALPHDAQVVGKTWRYVNKKGGPDRRFKDNRELPIALYEEMHLRSPSGLNELFSFSKIGTSQPFADSISAMAATLASLPSSRGVKAA